MRMAVNGIHLNIEDTGQGPPILLLHGFMGSIRSWDVQREALAARYRTVAVDLLGHGASDAPTPSDRYTMEHCVADLVAVLDELGISRTHVLGYSLGGRVALHLAAAAPQRIATLILESSSPGIIDPGARRNRRAADEALADFMETKGLQAFVDHWEQLPLWTSQQRLSLDVQESQRHERLRNQVHGLAGSLRGMGTGAMPHLWDRLPALGLPILVLAGRLDHKFCGLAEAMQAQSPAAELIIVPDAGHNSHLEQPEAFIRIIEAFWDKHPLADQQRHSRRAGIA